MVLGAWCFVLPLHAEESGFPITSVYSAAEVGARTKGWTTVQDRAGVLYFGCDELVSYDGDHWRTTAMDGGYALRGLDFGSDNKLWAAAVGNIGWFERKSGHDWTFHSLFSLVPPEHAKTGEFWQVFAEGEGAVFISQWKILRWDGQKFKVWSFPETRRITAMRVEGTLYVHHRDAGLFALRGNDLEKIISAEELGDTMVMAMEPRDNGWLLVTSRGLFTFIDRKLEPFAPEASAFLRRQSLTCALRLPDGRLVLGTWLGGIAILKPDGAIERILNPDDGLPERSISSLYLDREGGLWATTATRIFRLSLKSDSVYGPLEGLPRHESARIARWGDEMVVATEIGAFVLRQPQNRFEVLGLLREHVWDLQATPAGLLAARMKSVALISDGALKVIYRGSNNDTSIARPSRRVPGMTLISEGDRIVALDAEGKSRVIVSDLPDIPNSIAEDAAGRIWIGTRTAGTFVAEVHPADPVAAVPAEFGLPKRGGTALVADTETGALLVLTPEDGWVMGPGATRFEPVAGYPARMLTSYSSATADHQVWLLHSESNGRPAFVGRITTRGDHAEWQPHSVEPLSTIGTAHRIFAEKKSGGVVLWISGNGGLLRHEVPSELVAPIPHAPLLRAFANTEQVNAWKPIEGALAYHTKRVRFEFSAPEFGRRGSLRLETFIEGLDREWALADATARRDLTGLRDGNYTFRVRTVAETGAASAPAEFRFEILPPWWRTTPVVLGALFSLLPGAYAIYRLRVRALRRHNSDLEEKVRQRTEELARASAAKTEFVSNMSHDIRNPLNGIVGLALALEDTRLDARQREFVATLRECTTYLSTLVDDVLDFASIEAGKVELRPGPFAPHELLRSVVTTLKSEAMGQGGSLRIVKDYDLPPTLLGDAGRIQQILVNYASNAIKYAGGEIRLSACVAPDSPDEIEFSVSDEGPGLSEKEKTALFTKFSRLSAARREGISGAGLGLAACRLLADLMGGSVGVESSPGQGARFFLRLPMVAATEPAANDVSGFPLPSATVLVVEDADYNAWAAAAVLAKLGLPHERARNGREALELMAAKRFDIVLLDRNLPDMDGTEVARRIREGEADGPRAILLAVTAYCTSEDRELCLAAGMDAFVGKPLTPHKLRRVLLAAGRQFLGAASVHVSPDVSPVALSLNVSLLKYLSDGSEQGLDEQIGRFLATLSDADNRLARAAELQDLVTLGAVAHQVLSQAKMIGSVTLENAATALEQAANANDSLATGEFLREVRDEIQAVTVALRRRGPLAPTA